MAPFRPVFSAWCWNGPYNGPVHRVVAVRALEPYKLWLRFSDRSEGIVDLAQRMELTGVLARLLDPEEFRKVGLLRGWGAICWPGEIDLDPDVLYAWVHGTTVEVLLARPDSGR